MYQCSQISECFIGFLNMEAARYNHRLLLVTPLSSSTEEAVRLSAVFEDNAIFGYQITRTVKVIFYSL